MNILHENNKKIFIWICYKYESADKYLFQSTVLSYYTTVIVLCDIKLFPFQIQYYHIWHTECHGSYSMTYHQQTPLLHWKQKIISLTILSSLAVMTKLSNWWSFVFSVIYDNLLCHQWCQSCQIDELLFSLYVQKYILHNYIHHGDTTYWFRWWERQMAYSEDWFQLTLHQQLSQYVWWRKSWEYQSTQTLNQHRE